MLNIHKECIALSATPNIGKFWILTFKLLSYFINFIVTAQKKKTLGFGYHPAKPRH